MKFALFMGCKIPYYLEHYGTSTKAVLKFFKIEFKELDFNCCGYPHRDLHFEAYILSAARNMALAGKENLDIVTPCKCCFGSFKHAEYWLRQNESLKMRINQELAREGLCWEDQNTVKHLLSVLYHDVGVKTIASKIKFPQSSYKVAAHYGCHALRPSKIVNFDNPFAPTIFEELIRATGARTIDQPTRLDCCGHPLKEKNKRISLELMQNKITEAKEAGANCLCTACTYCQLQFDEMPDKDAISTLLYTQLLGLSLGILKEP